MNDNTPIKYDIERAPEPWSDLLSSTDERSALERAYRAVIVLLLRSGLRGLNDVKTAEIASLANINESTLFRQGRRRDALVADAVDWCWANVNERISATHHEHPTVGSSATELIMTDLNALLKLFETDEGKLIGTGAMLSFRRAEHLTDGFDFPHQMKFRDRLALLTKALVDGCPTAGHDSDVIATYLTNYVSTVWFTWLADPSSRQPDGFLNLTMVDAHLTSTLHQYSSCAFKPSDVATG